jgi:hypothetical protein
MAMQVRINASGRPAYRASGWVQRSGPERRRQQLLQIHARVLADRRAVISVMRSLISRTVCGVS